MSSSSAAARTATNASTTSREFLDELYELLERDKDKKNTVILELILQQWQQIGDERHHTRNDNLVVMESRHILSIHIRLFGVASRPPPNTTNPPPTTWWR
ncbi:hypothetical protein SPBR_01101 [Sporothrix brasiliensis 5110]|uniref:Uncharacterized protein n=1 Tax=Sporothrix brasiliensis 5110 TaxID=1398154 RepID=A0A0C2EU44_9PEZI|nr:uncharacterized protein SPBR_01101 [Sporothrix brasiliensis 5110]KIH90069.1 hypothetical protein SPBR_01101 [Sporothrix brasiliensis 5110]